MATKILFSPNQPEEILSIARTLTPPGYELVVADVGTPKFYDVAPEIEYFMGLSRGIGGEFFRSRPR